MRKAAIGFITALPFVATSAVAQSPPLWTGVYAGMNGGFGGGAFKLDDARFNPNIPIFPAFESRAADSRGSGFFVGGQFGYLHRFDNQAVFGVETDMQWSDIQRAAHGGVSTLNGRLGGVESSRGGIDWFGTTRVRSGYAIGRLLPYATFGVAYGHLTSASVGADSIQSIGVSRATQGIAGGMRVGWTAGAGAEYALTRNLAFKTEYLYTQFGGVGGSTATYIPAIGAPPATGWMGGWGAGPFSASRIGLHLLRAGLNYNFGVGGGFADASFEAAGMETRDWTGFYAGINGGYGGGVAAYDQQQLTKSLAGDIVTRGAASARADGAIAGGQAGYNYQLSNGFVLGVETDAQWSDIKWSNLRSVYSAPPAGSIALEPVNGVRGELSWFGTTRARLGFGFDRVMPFVTGGFAYGGVDAQSYASRIWPAGGVVFIDFDRASASGVKAGWTAGGGVEYAITEQLSFKTQYDYLDLAGASGAGAGVVTEGVAVTVGGSVVALNASRIGALSTEQLGLHIVRAGLNWRFTPPTF